LGEMKRRRAAGELRDPRLDLARELLDRHTPGLDAVTRQTVFDRTVKSLPPWDASRPKAQRTPARGRKIEALRRAAEAIVGPVSGDDWDEIVRQASVGLVWDRQMPGKAETLLDMAARAECGHLSEEELDMVLAHNGITAGN
jgi:hypothetical protein